MQTRPFHAKLAFSIKKKTFGVGFKLRRPAAKQQCYGARGSPDPPWPYGEQRARGEIGKRCVPEQRRFGAEVCAPSPVSLCRMQLLEARFLPFRR